MTNKHLSRFLPFVFLQILSLQSHSLFSQRLLDSLIQKNHYTFTSSKDSISGTAVDFLRKEMQNTQFILIGENHNTDKIPEFTTQLFKMLNENYGFNYFACEQGPVSMETISADPAFRSVNNLTLRLQHFPYSLTFCTDQEIGMLSNILNISQSRNAIWGCDQAFATADALATIKSRDVILDSFYRLAISRESIRDKNIKYHYIYTPDDSSLMKYIRHLQFSEKDKFKNFVYSSLLVSDTIYDGIRLNNYYASRSRREEYMKERFFTEYSKAIKPKSLPKVLLKFGNDHTTYGFNTGSNVLSLGTFVSQLAKMNGKKCLSLNTLILRKDSSNWDLSTYPDAKYLSFFIKRCDTLTSHLIDLRPIRHFFYNGYLNKEIPKEMHNEFEGLVFGFDFLVFISNGKSGSFKAIRGE